MENNLTFEKAFNDLTQLVEQIEDDKIQVDKLTEKVKEASELIRFCETKLRAVEDETTLNQN